MQQFIKAILKTLKAVCNYIEEAYEMTYKETSRDFHKEVKKRQKENRYAGYRGFNYQSHCRS
jgi:lipoate-protein ligase A